MDPLHVPAGAAIFAGAALQSAIGFGFSLVAAPLVFAALEPEQAVGLLLVLSLVSHVMTLGTEGRRPQPLTGDVLRLLAWSVPGLVAGAFVLRSVDGRVLQVVLTVAVFASLAVTHFTRDRAPRGDSPRAWWAAPLAGLGSGALTTSITTGGPPLVLYLLAAAPEPARMRDSLITCFMAMALMGAGVLALVGAGGGVPPGAWLAAGVPLVAAGQIAGRPLFARLEKSHYEAVLTAALVVSATIGLVTALA